MGGDLGTRVARALEDAGLAGELVGTDADPPRRRLRSAHFHRIDPRDRRRLAALVREVAPEVVVHLGVYEPDARAPAAAAGAMTASAALAVLGAAAETGALRAIVVRSGIEVYGRRRGSVTVPDESVPPDPTSAFGRSLLEVERVAAAAGRTADVPVAALRLAPLAGSHVPSPLVRLLRLPVVPFEGLADPPFCLLHPGDAAAAVVAAVRAQVDGPVNVVAAGAVTAAQAARLGGRVPFPVTGPGWAVVRRLTSLAGAPLPDHVAELLRRGRAADASAAATLLGVVPEHSALDVVKDVYEWAPVAPLAREAAA
jgi:UDP-glucose 4-epimerase